MKTKEKKSKPAKETDDKKEEQAIQQTEQIDKKEKDIPEKKEEQKKFTPYMLKVEAMELIISVWFRIDKYNSRDGIDNTIDKKTGKYIDPKMKETIQKYTIPFSKEEIMKIMLAPDFVCNKAKNKTFDETKQPNIEAEKEEMSYNKRMLGYNVLSKNKEYSLLDFCNDMKETGCHFDLRTYGERLFDYEKYIKDIEIENFFYDNSSTYRLSVDTLLNTKGFHITFKDRNELKNYLRRYLDCFMEDKLSKKGLVNVYTYKAHLKKVAELFQEDYENCGKTLTIDYEEYKDKDKKFRLIECLLALRRQKYIKLDSFFYNKEGKLKIVLTFLKEPKEISEITQDWITFGDLKVNEKLSKAIYKGKEKEFLKDVDRFAALCFLIKHPNEYVSFEDLIKATDKLGREYKKFNERVQKEKKEKKYTELDRFEKAEKNKEYKKEEDSYRKKVSQLTTRVQQRLGIDKDPNRTIHITSNKKKGFMLHKK